jgi:hypothetical protein
MEDSGAPNPKRRWQRRREAGDAEEKGGYVERVMAGGQTFGFGHSWLIESRKKNLIISSDLTSISLYPKSIFVYKCTCLYIMYIVVVLFDNSVLNENSNYLL